MNPTHTRLLEANSLVVSKRPALRADFSPSQLKMAADDPELGLAGGCHRSWVLRYLYGAKPAGTASNFAFGTLVHAALEAHMLGYGAHAFARCLDARKTAELSTVSADELATFKERAPTCAISALHLLPKREECEQVHCESAVSVDTRELCAFEPLKITGSADLVVVRDGRVYLYDYKTTAGRWYGPKAEQGPWVYVPTADVLRTDVQLIVYALATMQRFNVRELACRWVYMLAFRPDDRVVERRRPQATCVDVHVTYDEMVAAIQPWLALANRLRLALRLWKSGARPGVDDLPIPALTYPHPDSPCNAYRGCVYHVNNGGVCAPSPTIDESPFDMFDGIETPTEEKEQTMTDVTYSPPGSTLANRLAGFHPEALAQMPPEGQAIAAGVAPATPPPVPAHAREEPAPAPQATRTSGAVSLPQIIAADYPPWGPPTGEQARTVEGYDVTNTHGVRLDTHGHPMPPPAAPTAPAAPAASSTPAAPVIPAEQRQGGKPRRARATKERGPETDESLAARVAAWERGLAQPEPVCAELVAQTPAPPAAPTLVGHAHTIRETKLEEAPAEPAAVTAVMVRDAALRALHRRLTDGVWDDEKVVALCRVIEVTDALNVRAARVVDGDLVLELGE